jgi:Glyoxalase-like domain
MPATKRSGKGKGTLWLGSVVVDCTDLDRMIAFWQEALHYVPREAAEPDGVVLKDPSGVGPNLSLYRSSEVRVGKYRLHLDLYSATPEREVVRLLRLGATLVKPAEDEDDFVTLADPDGNLFDVIDKSGWEFGRRV